MSSVAIESLALSEPLVRGGGTVRATVTLSGLAPEGGAPVKISHDSPAVGCPELVHIPAGTLAGEFDVVASPVDALVTVTLTGTYGGTSRSAPLVVLPRVVLEELTIAPASTVGGAVATGTLRLSGPAHMNLRVELETTAPDAVVLWPPHLDLGEGLIHADFPIHTRRVARTVDATVYATFGGVTKPARLEVTVS